MTESNRGKPKGRVKTGGRKKGCTIQLRDWINDVLTSSRTQFKKDLKQLNPEDRVRIYVNLLSYVIPKMQALGGKEQEEIQYANLLKMIDDAPDKLVDAIIAKKEDKLNADPDGSKK